MAASPNSRMEVGFGVVVQVTTQQRAPDGSYAVAEALTYCPDCQVMEDKEGNLFIGNPNVIDTRFPLHHPKNL